MKKLSKSDFQLSRAEEETLREEANSKPKILSDHFMPGTRVSSRGIRSALIIEINLDQMLVETQEGERKWIRPFGLQFNRIRLAISETSQEI